MPSDTPERQPFDMDCNKCEYERTCWIPLKVANKLTRRWFTFCKQGRKRKVIKQSTIQEAIDRFNARIGSGQTEVAECP
jgi:hypothetical protein